jgi:hypothetical protein
MSSFCIHLTAVTSSERVRGRCPFATCDFAAKVQVYVVLMRVYVWCTRIQDNNMKGLLVNWKVYGWYFK